MVYSEHERQNLTRMITEEIKGLTPENIEFLIDMLEGEMNSGFDCGYDAGYNEGEAYGRDLGYNDGYEDGNIYGQSLGYDYGLAKGREIASD